jgi:hypothetical protein
MDRQPVLTLILVALALLTSYELVERRDEQRNIEIPAEPAYLPVHRAADQAGVVAARAAPSPTPVARQDPAPVPSPSIGTKPAVDPDELRDRIERAESRLAALKAARESDLQRDAQETVFEEVRAREAQLGRELGIAQLRDALARERAVAADLARRLREFEFLNYDSDAFRETRERAAEQGRKVAQLEERYRAYLFESAAQDAADTARLRLGRDQGQASDSRAALDQSISEAEADLASARQLQAGGSYE